MKTDTTPNVLAIAALRAAMAVDFGSAITKRGWETEDFEDDGWATECAESLATQLNALPALLDAAERCAFLERVAEQAVLLGGLSLSKEPIEYHGDETPDLLPDLAAYLRSKSASDAGQENK